MTTKTITIALSAVLLATAAQAAGGIQINPNMPRPSLARVACDVAGTPSEFPDDVSIRNAGLTTLPAGTRIFWQVPFANKQGSVVLASALAPGKGMFLSGVLAGGVEAGKPCKASLI